MRLKGSRTMLMLRKLRRLTTLESQSIDRESSSNIMRCQEQTHSYSIWHQIWATCGDSSKEGSCIVSRARLNFALSRLPNNSHRKEGGAWSRRSIKPWRTSCSQLCKGRIGSSFHLRKSWCPLRARKTCKHHRWHRSLTSIWAELHQESK